MNPKVEEFFQSVSGAFAANRSNAWIAVAGIIFFIIMLYFYYKYFMPSSPSGTGKKTGPRPRHFPDSSPNHIIEEIFYGEQNREALSLKNLVNFYIDKYVQNSLDPVIINALNSKYWDLVSYIVRKKVQNSKNNLLEISFNRTEKLVIDFAYLSDKLIFNIDNFDESLFDEALISTTHLGDWTINYYPITSWLIESLKDFTSANAVEKLSGDYEIINMRIQTASQEKEIGSRTRKLLLYEVGKQNAGKPEAKTIAELSGKMERLIDKYSFYKFRSQSGVSMTKDEMVEFVNIEKFLINSLRNERRDAFKGVAYGERYNNELINLENEIISKEIELLKLVSQKGHCFLEINKTVSRQNKIKAKDNNEFLASKIEYIKSMLALVAKRNEIEPILFMTKRITRYIPDSVFQVIAKFVESDPNVFKNKTAQSQCLPSIIFVPGCGNGIYVSEINSLIFPEFPIKDFNDLVITALALYRWECDDNGDLKRSFHALRANKRLSFAALQQVFIKSYITYVTMEKEGSSGLERDILDWFKYEVAPKKGEEIKIEIKNRQELKDEAEANFVQERTESIENQPEPGVSVEAKETAAIASASDKNINSMEVTREVVYDKLKLFLKNDFNSDKIIVDVLDGAEKINITIGEISIKSFDEIMKILYDDPKLRDYLIELFKKI